MKTIKNVSLFLLLLMAVVTASGQGIVFEHGTWAEVKAKSIAMDKPIFVDCFTDWCGPCKWMAANTFTNEGVAEYFNENFICYKLDMEKGEGKDFADRHKIRAYPTLCFVNGEDEMLFRKAGALDAEAFVKLGAQALDPEQQIPTLLKKYADGNREPAFVQQYILILHASGMEYYPPLKQYREAGNLKGAKLLEKGNFDIFSAIFQKVDSEEFLYFRDNHAKFVATFGDMAEYKLSNCYNAAIRRAVNAEDEDAYKNMLTSLEEANLPRSKELIAMCKMNYALMTKDWEAYAPAAVDYMALLEEPNWRMLNSTAWTFFEHVTDESYLKFACAWAKHSTELEKNSYNMDTHAMLLYKCGKYEEAIPVAEEAIALAEKEGTDLKETKEALAEMKKK